jgi:lipoprotein-anchoring transpeptidase ErfK/SrfK
MTHPDHAPAHRAAPPAARWARLAGVAALAAAAPLAFASPGSAQAGGTVAVDPVPPGSTTAAKPIAQAPTERRAWTARVLLPTVGRATPSTRARVVRRISPYAPYDRGPQVLLVLGAAQGPGGPWYRVLLPSRPNGSSAWVQASALQVTPTPYRVRVRISTRRAQLVRAGRVVATWRVGVGTPQNPTPVGLWAVSEVVPQARPGGFYGPYIVTLAAHSERLSDFDGGQGQVALHGTNLPGLLGGAVSHGCVRFPNAAIRRVAAVVPPGAPVEVLR